MMKAVVLTLKRREDRKKIFLENNTEETVKAVEFFEGTDGNDLICPNAYTGNRGSLGCTSSHARALLNFICSKDKHLVVLEIDAKLERPLSELFEAAAKLKGKEILYFNGTQVERDDPDERGFFKPRRVVLGTWGYAVTKAAAKVIVERILMNPAPHNNTQLQYDRILVALNKAGELTQLLVEGEWASHCSGGNGRDHRRPRVSDNNWKSPASKGLGVAR